MEKAISLLVAGAVLVGCYLQPIEGIFLPIALLLLVPMTLIWFAGEVGAWAGPSGRGFLTSSRPTYQVKVAGWGLILIMLLVLIAVSYSSR